MSAPPKYDPTPQYGATEAAEAASSSQPLLQSSSTSKPPAGFSLDDATMITGASSASANAWTSHADDDIPDDFKVGVNVADCDESIRRAFLRKVYAILLVQLALTATVGGVLNFHDGAKDYVQSNPWIIWTSMIGSFASLFAVYVKRHSYPTNVIVLTVFTFFEAIMVGTATSFYESTIVIQALLITLGIFVGLTLFTFQTKLDFSGLGPFLFAGLIGLFTTGLVHMFIPFGKGLDLALACGGVVIFSGFILYDTQQIMKRTSVDEAIWGAISLYLDVLNLFLYVLRLVSPSHEEN